MTPTPPGVTFANPEEIRNISWRNGRDRLEALDVVDLAKVLPRRGSRARISARLLDRLTDLSPANTDRLRCVVAAPIRSGRWGGRPDGMPKPLSQMTMATGAAIMLVRLGIHPVAYALYSTITPLLIMADGIRISDMLAGASNRMEMALTFQTPGNTIAWRPAAGTLTIKDAGLPSTIMNALVGRPLNVLIRHPMTDMIDVPIAAIDGSSVLKVVCRIRDDVMRLEDIDPVALADDVLDAR